MADDELAETKMGLALDLFISELDRMLPVAQRPGWFRDKSSFFWEKTGDTTCEFYLFVESEYELKGNERWEILNSGRFLARTDPETGIDSFVIAGELNEIQKIFRLEIDVEQLKITESDCVDFSTIRPERLITFERPEK